MRRKILAAALVFALVVVCFVSLQVWPGGPRIAIVWATGDAINWLTVEQWSGSAWVQRANFTATAGSVRVSDSLKIRFNMSGQFDENYALDADEADAYTYCNMTITSTEPYSLAANMTNYYHALNGAGTFYILKETYTWDVADYPKAATTYTVAVTFRGYY